MTAAIKSRASRNSPSLIVAPRRDLAVEFANTLAWRGSTPEESLHSVGELLAWLSANNAMEAVAKAGLEKWFEAHPARGAEVFREAIDLRETIYRLLKSVASSSMPSRDDLRRMNTVLSETAPRVYLERTERSFGWRIEMHPSPAGILAPVLWSVADILVGPDRARLRECGNDRCLWLFLDDSKNQTRRWCSMQACGNRAKAHRHYLRQKGE
jgi:predicted RNA-binding Zn ribbon-like protein